MSNLSRAAGAVSGLCLANVKECDVNPNSDSNS